MATIFEQFRSDFDIPVKINLFTPLTIRTAFAFPLQNRDSRREILRGARWLLLPGIGWILNMGHRIQMVHNMQHGREAWPAWNDYPKLFKLGGVTFLGMVEYHLPAVIVGYFAWKTHSSWLWLLADALWITATIAIPGYMTHYCLQFDASEVFNPIKALRRVFQGGVGYWKAWAIALMALCVSLGGLVVFGYGFLVTSVWFWQVAGYSFATVFANRFNLRSIAQTQNANRS